MIEKYSCNAVQLLISIVVVLINIEQVFTGKGGEFKPTSAILNCEMTYSVSYIINFKLIILEFARESIKSLCEWNKIYKYGEIHRL